MINAKALLVLMTVTTAVTPVRCECDPYTQCFGHGDYNPTAKTCSCYSVFTVNAHWGPYTGKCCESTGCIKPNATCEHGVCGLDGIHCDHCQTGWTGPNCGNVTACFPWLACAHGRCTKSRFRCECDPGWHGDLCDRCMCNVPCYFGSCPSDPNKCVCQDNYYSSQTGCDRSYCAVGWQCQNGGYCVDARHCKCPPHYTGSHCEYISNCSVPCTHGRCNKNPAQCECENNWSGADCSKYIGLCKNCSSVGGTCFDGPDTCKCKPGYTGPTCSVQKCDGCFHGSCVIAGGKKSCTCDYGWLNNVGVPNEFNPGKGPCTKIWKCIPPCVNGACPNDPFKCECRAPYTGTECDVTQCPDCCPPETCDCSAGHAHCRPDWHHDCCLVKSCFRGDTLVHTARGLVAIKDIKVGDMVVTRHEGDAPEVTYLRRVDQVRKQFASPKDLVVFRSNGEDIWVTQNHPFYVEGTKSWVSAVHVTTADTLQAVKGKTIRLEQKVQALQLMASNSKIPVYDLSVKEYDRYMVGKDGLLASSCNTTNTLQSRDRQVWGTLGRPLFVAELPGGKKQVKQGPLKNDKQSVSGDKEEDSSSPGLVALAAIGGVCLIIAVAVIINKYRQRRPYKTLEGNYLVTESTRQAAF